MDITPNNKPFEAFVAALDDGQCIELLRRLHEQYSGYDTGNRFESFIEAIEEDVPSHPHCDWHFEHAREVA